MLNDLLKMNELYLYAQSIRYLKPVQIWGRLSRIFKKRFLKILVNSRNYKIQEDIASKRRNLLLRSAPEYALQEDLGRKRFHFLNHEIQFDNIIDWNSARVEKLWLYNLHYFEYLIPLTHQSSSSNFRLGKSIIEDWIENNPVGYGNGWEPYPLSLRIVNWIFFFDAFFEEFQSDKKFSYRFLNSLYQQSSYLTHFLEYHLLANHFFENIKSLFLAGLFFQNERWVKRAWRLLLQEVGEQILPDGGHYERSPMYHSIILVGVLDILNVLRASRKVDPKFFEMFSFSSKMENEISKLQAIAEKMIYWLQAMTHPDGEIALIGDSAFNMAPRFEQIRHYYETTTGNKVAEPLTSGNRVYKDSGYYIFKSARHFMVVDCGELGVRYQPGHAHCDLLSYEYSFGGSRFIVDSGLGNYLETDLRRKARSIYSHNSVVVNGLEQAELWKVFRVGRWVNPSSSTLDQNEDRVTFAGRYENSLNVKDKYVHYRKISFVNQAFFVIDDLIEGSSIRSIECLIHLHPSCEFQHSTGSLRLTQSTKTIYLFWNSQSTSSELREWFYAPEYGKVYRSQKLVLKPAVANIMKLRYVIAPSEYAQEAREYLSGFNQV